MKEEQKAMCEGETEENKGKEKKQDIGHPFYQGVRKMRWGKWVSEIREPKKKQRIWLGSFETPEMAARAHDAATFFFKGGSAKLNFPNDANTLPKPSSNCTRDIKAAATAAALGEKFGETTKSASFVNNADYSDLNDLDEFSLVDCNINDGFYPYYCSPFMDPHHFVDVGVDVDDDTQPQEILWQF